MQLNPQIRLPGQFGFQLPSLNLDIPVRTVLIESAVSNSDKFARDLLDIGIIDPDDIHDTAISARDILEQGLGAWISKRCGTLKRLHLSFGIISPTVAGDFVHGLQDANDALNYGAPVLYIGQPGEEYTYLLKRHIDLLDGVCEGLFSAAWSAICFAQGPAVSLRTPDEVFDHFCYQWYETDSSCTQSDEDVANAIEALKERFEEDPVEDYLPHKAREAFGAQYWSGPRKSLSKKDLNYLAEHSENGLVKQVASATRDLLKLTTKANKLKASLPDLCGVEAAYPIFRASSLQYQDHQLTWQTIDDLIEDGYNSGDNGEYLGLRQIPSTKPEIKTFFKQLDAALAVMRQMDTLISLISDPL